MFGLGFGELVIIFFVVLIFLGPKRLPELAKGVGKGIREFQKAMRGEETDHIVAEKKIENSDSNKKA